MQLARLLFRGTLLVIFAIALSLANRNTATESLASDEPQGLFAMVVNVMMQALATARTSVLFGTDRDGMAGVGHDKGHFATLGYIVTGVASISGAGSRGEASPARSIDHDHARGSAPAEQRRAARQDVSTATKASES